MKASRYFLPLALSALLLGGSGCSDKFTDLTPQGGITEANFWKSEADAIAGTNAIYSWMYDSDMFGRGYFWMINASDDMVTGRTRASAEATCNFTCTGDESDLKYMYPQSYNGIRRANEVLKNVPGMDIDAKLKNRLLGDAHFMRAFYYFHIASRYGDHRAGLPIVTVENMNATSFVRPAHVIENYAMIVDDLQKAAELLPIITEMQAIDYGRAHKDAALAYIAKTYSFWAQYDQSKWAEVVKAADAVAASGSGRALINTGNPAKDFRSVFTVAQNWSSEYIWSAVSGKQTGSILPGCMLENTGWGMYNGWGYFHPTLELYDAFEEGDPRREATILSFGDEFSYLGQERRYASSNSQTGFQFNKYMEPYAYPAEVHLNPNGNRPTTDLNVPILRYAEVLLLKAEALIMMGQVAEAAEPLNQVRQRAGLAPIVTPTLEDLKQERRVELAGEFADRHADLVRWKDAQAVYAKPLHGRAHSDKTNPDSPYAVVEVWPARSFNPEVHHVWPIPPAQLANSTISQNQGW